MFVVIIYRVTRVKGAFVDYMALLESQDPLVQRQGTIYCALMRLDFCSLVKLCISWVLSNLPALPMQGERGIPGQQGVPGQPGRSIAGPKVHQIKLHHQTVMREIFPWKTAVKMSD